MRVAMSVCVYSRRRETIKIWGGYKQEGLFDLASPRVQCSPGACLHAANRTAILFKMAIEISRMWSETKVEMDISCS